MKEVVAKRLITLRGNRSRREIASAVGVSLSAIQMYENGQRMPNDDIKRKLAKYFEVTVEELFFTYKEHDMCSLARNEHAATLETA